MIMRDKKVLVIGAAKSGLAAAEFLAEQGACVYLNDIKEIDALEQKAILNLEKKGVKLCLGRHADTGIIGVDLVVISPGVPMNIPPVLEAQKNNIPLWSEMELASQYCSAPMVVITGTNGKTTTTALIGEIFANAGRGVFVGGNIGTPFIMQSNKLKAEDVAVLEASSFQLETTEKFKPKVALILNITPDHIDRHGSLAGYIAAKAKIFTNQSEQDWLVLNWDDQETRKLATQSSAQVIFFSRKEQLKVGLCVIDGSIVSKLDGKVASIIKIEDIYIRGGHNLENALAATAAALIMGIKPEDIKKTLSTFPGVAHRLERVMIHQGVEFINDSKGTNPDASIKALEAYERPIILIAGGKNKGSDFLPFAEVINKKVKALILLGQAAGEIEKAVQKVGYHNYITVKDYPEAVIKAAQMAQEGDVVLLSPACASWDMFRNYEERGDLFKELVRKIASEV